MFDRQGLMGMFGRAAQKPSTAPAPAPMTSPMPTQGNRIQPWAGNRMPWMQALNRAMPVRQPAPSAPNAPAVQPGPSMPIQMPSIMPALGGYGRMI